MKKHFLVAVCLLTTPVVTLAGNRHAAEMRQEDWMRSKTGTWAARKNGKTCWYKLDRNAQVWWSKDGVAWQSLEGGMWTDKSGRWLKIGDGKLWWTTDGGKNFNEVSEWKWEAPDGKWYKFDAKWTLWVNR